MANKTPNYNLIKPSADDFYNIDVPNGNMDIIDAELKKSADHISDDTKHNQATENGGALGNDSVATSGGAMGCKAETNAGGAVGYLASSNSGGAMGYMANAQNGGAIGEESESNNGGAMGYKSKTSHGCAIGHMAVTAKEDGTLIDAIQLGMGTNTVEKTLQAYAYRLMEANGKIPIERMIDGVGKFKRGTYTGTGLCGENNPNTLTFDFTPKFVQIIEPYWSNGSYAYHTTPQPFIYGMSKAYTASYTTGRGANLTWGTNQISWYIDSAKSEYAHAQLNRQGATYYYFAIG